MKTAYRRRWHIALGLIATATSGTLWAQSGGGASERVRFEDAHVRFVEVTRWPGTVQVAPEPYDAIIAVDAAWPTLRERDGGSNRNDFGVAGHPPHDIVYPWCQTHGPLGAQRLQVVGRFPQHFYRFEYKRVDGPDFSANWRSWYPWILAPVRLLPDMGHTPQPGKPFSAEWPYPMVYNAVTAAPANHFVRYEDAHIQLVEVTVRPGETENMHGHPYRSVYANDGAGPTDPVPPNQMNHTLHPVSVPPWGGPKGRGGPPPGEAYPDCLAAAPEAPHQVHNPAQVPEHFFRLQYKRIDGDAIKTQWRTWYPQP